MTPQNAQPPESATAAPALRTDITISEPSDDGKVTISDPRNNRHYLVSALTLQVLMQFDGTRTQEGIVSTLDEAGVHISSQALHDVLAKADSLGLFGGPSPPQANAAAHLRGPSRRNLLFFQIAELDPTPAVVKLQSVGRLLFSKGAVILLLALIIWAALVIIENTDRYIASLALFGSFTAWGLVYVANVVVTGCHEFGHALAVGRFGGVVPRMGIALYLFSPAAYTDTSSAWAFPRIRDRLIVSLGGVYVESFILTGGVILWGANLLPPLASTTLFLLCHVIVTRIVLNLNPLLRLDGYWVLSDCLQIPNLRAKAFVTLTSMFSSPSRRRRRLTFIRNPEEKLLLIAYAVLSTLTLMIGLTVGYITVDQLARRSFDWYGDVASRVMGFGAVAIVLWNGWRYLRSLRTANFVGANSDAS